MKEFVDKLIGRLEEKKFSHTQFDGVMPETIEVVTICGVINIINELAKEYNNGWIPCSERLPEENKAVLVCTNENQIDVDYYGGYIKDFIGLKGTEQYAIAWQPLPQPYKAGD